MFLDRVISTNLSASLTFTAEEDSAVAEEEAVSTAEETGVRTEEEDIPFFASLAAFLAFISRNVALWVCASDATACCFTREEGGQDCPAVILTSSKGGVSILHTEKSHRK